MSVEPVFPGEKPYKIFIRILVDPDEDLVGSSSISSKIL